MVSGEAVRTITTDVRFPAVLLHRVESCTNFIDCTVEDLLRLLVARLEQDTGVCLLLLGPLACPLLV